MISQISAILNNVSVILMILAVKVLVTIHSISCHLIRLSEERFVLNLLQNLLHWFSKHSVKSVGWSGLPAKSLRGRLFWIRSDLESLLSWGIAFAFPFPYNRSSSILLYLSILSISRRTLVIGLPIRDFLKSCSAGKPALKVLIATSS